MTRGLGSILTKTLRDDRRRLIAWSVGAALFVLLMALFWPTVEERGEEFARLFEEYPPSFQVLFGDRSDIQRLLTPEGFLHTEMFTFMMPLLFILYAIGRGADAIAGEERRRTLDVLLARPVSRRTVVLHKAGAVFAGVGILAAAVFTSLVVFGSATGMVVPLARLLAVCLLLALVASVFGGLALLVGAATGRKGLAVGVAGAAAVATFLLNGLPQLVEALEPYRVLSPFYYYLAGDPLFEGLNVAHALVLAALAAASVLAAVALFERRDVSI